MASPSVICYPHAFLERPEDRSFLIELGMQGVHEDTARLFLYRIWADFATGGSDRRAVDPKDLSADRQVRVLESFCGWKGEAGLLVRMAVEAGFLRLERTGESPMLVCAGFYPINSAWSSSGRSFQKRGAYTRSMRAQSEIASREAAQREELWSRTGGASSYRDIPEAQRKDALRFIYRVCRALGMAVPEDSVLAAGPFRLAVEHLRETPVKRLDETLIWLLSRRKSPDIPERLDAVLRAWPEFVKKCSEEMV